MNKRVQFITDPRPGIPFEEQVKMVLSSGIDWVQFRMKNGSFDEKLSIGRELVRLCRRHNAVLIINDDVELAFTLGADGVHLGLEDTDPVLAREKLGGEAIIGGTCNTFADILQRKQQGVDYVGLGPFAFTRTKKKLSPVLGLKGYREIMAQCREYGITLPVVAIGGITCADIGPLMKTTIHGIALSSLILDAPDRASMIKAIRENILQ